MIAPRWEVDPCTVQLTEVQLFCAEESRLLDIGLRNSYKITPVTVESHVSASGGT